MRQCVSRLTALLCSLLLSVGMTMNVSADATTEMMTTETTETIAEASQLIMNHTLLCTSSKNTLYITGSVTGTDTMAQIGFIDFEIERSSNGTSGWTSTSYSVPDQVKENTITHGLAQYAVSVTGGYYYRVCLKVYAKEKGWFFPRSQTVSDESNAVWVPAS